MNHDLGYSFIPQKVVRKRPIFSKEKVSCPTCRSTELNWLGNAYISRYTCTKCKTSFPQKIIGYDEYISEENVEQQNEIGRYLNGSNCIGRYEYYPK